MAFSLQRGGGWDWLRPLGCAGVGQFLKGPWANGSQDSPFWGQRCTADFKYAPKMSENTLAGPPEDKGRMMPVPGGDGNAFTRAQAAVAGLPRWARRAGWILSGAVGVLLVVAIIGASTSAHNFAVAGKLLGEVRALEAIEIEQAATITDWESHGRTYERMIKETQDEMKTLEASVKAREEAVAAAEVAVAAREGAAVAAEAQKARQEFGNGVRVIGTTVEPGTYQTAGPKDAMCYYAWKTGTGSDADIVDNNITQGAATVTLAAGEVFESSMCTVWTKVG